MAKEDRYYERLGKYNFAGFACNVDKNFLTQPGDQDRFDAAKEALESVGFSLNYENGRLSLSMDAETYLNVATRKAGPKGKKIETPSHQDNKGYTVYYSDILLMMQTMKDTEIMKELNIPKATYYRHKKDMLASEYYKELDKSRLDDEMYLKEAEYDRKF